jgi:DnaK suppressor protein
MAEIDLDAMRQRLEQLRQEYQAQIEDLTVGEEQVIPSDPGHDGDVSDDPADDADAMSDAERDLSLADNARMQLELVEAALGRIEAGTYGVCPDCGRQIDPRRLNAIPYAVYCMDDQIKHEEQEA